MPTPVPNRLNHAKHPWLWANADDVCGDRYYGCDGDDNWRHGREGDRGAAHLIVSDHVLLVYAHEIVACAAMPTHPTQSDLDPSTRQ